MSAERLLWAAIACIVLTGVALAAGPAEWRAPDPKTAPCERFGALPLDEVPARCWRHFTADGGAP